MPRVAVQRSFDGQSPESLPGCLEDGTADAQDTVQKIPQGNCQDHRGPSPSAANLRQDSEKGLISSWLKRTVGCRPDSQISQQRFGLDQVGKREAFGEPRVDWGKQMDCLCLASLAAPDAGETPRRPAAPTIALSDRDLKRLSRRHFGGWTRSRCTGRLYRTR
jgi:hypothetical protein